MRTIPLLLALGLLTGAAPAPVGMAVPCASLFLGGMPPRSHNPAIAVGSVLLCNEGSAVLTSAVTRGAIWSAEHLTADSVAFSRDLASPPALHADARLPADGRAEETDYRDAGFIPTPLAVPEDMTSAAGRLQATGFSNVVPMIPGLHGHLWPVFEAMARHLAAREDELFVVTGVAFTGDRLRTLHDRVMVPTAVWKAVYQPDSPGMAGAWLCRNIGGFDCRIVSIDRLIAETGIDPFPALPAVLRASPHGLPQPGSPLNSGFPVP